MDNRTEKRIIFLLSIYSNKLITRAKNDFSIQKSIKDNIDYLDIFIFNFLQSFSNYDPSLNKCYLRWIVEQYIKENFLYEDLSRIGDVLSSFMRIKSKLKEKDIYKYSLHQLEEIIDNINNPNKTTEIFVQSNYDNIANVEYLYKGPLGIFAIPHTKEAAIELGRGTKWCTSAINNNRFTEYDTFGKLHILIDKKGDKYQFYLSDSNAIMFADSSDRLIDDCFLTKLREEYFFLNECILNYDTHTLHTDITLPSQYVFEGEVNNLISYHQIRRNILKIYEEKENLHNSNTWLKFNHNGKTLYVSKYHVSNKIDSSQLEHRLSKYIGFQFVSKKDWSNKFPYFGTQQDLIPIKGKKFYPRLPLGYNINNLSEKIPSYRQMSRILGLVYYLGEESACVKFSEFNIFKKHFDLQYNQQFRNFTYTQVNLLCENSSRFDYDLNITKKLDAEELGFSKGKIRKPGQLYRSVACNDKKTEKLVSGCRLVLEEI